jgi:hypothetical protein
VALAWPSPNKSPTTWVRNSNWRNLQPPAVCSCWNFRCRPARSRSVRHPCLTWRAASLRPGMGVDYSMTHDDSEPPGKSARGLAQSKTLRAVRRSPGNAPASWSEKHPRTVRALPVLRSDRRAKNVNDPYVVASLDAANKCLQHMAGSPFISSQ